MISQQKQSQNIPDQNSNLSYRGAVKTIIKFIYFHLPKFQIKNKFVVPGKEEGSYNIQLEDYFQKIARKQNSIFYFSGNRLNEREAYPDLAALKVEGHNHRSFFDIECKRLNTSLQHVKQYVSGKTGGIERFKRNQHGTNLKYSAIIGYIENETHSFWFDKINSWIKEKINDDNQFWSNDDLLKNKKCIISTHNRINSQVPIIYLLHLSVNV
jgi:hypothetical protein